MSALICGICQRECGRDKCHIERLTPEEVVTMTSSGQKFEEEYVYCRPCWKTMTNPATGPQFMKGLFEVRLRQLGVSNAEAMATEYLKRLLEMRK